MTRITGHILGLCFSAFAISAGAESLGDPERGAKIFRKCKACHEIGKDARHKVGPALSAVLNEPIGTGEDYKYSKAFKELAAQGALWSYDNLDAFLKRPKQFAKGTRMSFAGLKKPEERADVIAFLVGQSPVQDPEPTFAVSPDILALEGDLDYGEYLSSECVTCHQSDGSTAGGVPSITNWPIEDFVVAMHAYREKHRENPVMRMVAGRLSDDEIAALAAYFNSLEN